MHTLLNETLKHESFWEAAFQCNIRRFELNDMTSPLEHIMGVLKALLYSFKFMQQKDKGKVLLYSKSYIKFTTYCWQKPKFLY